MDRNSRWLASGLPLLLGIVLPAAIAFYYVFRFGFNVPVYDEWDFMPTVDTFYADGDWWPMVVEHYGEHRMVLPKLIILYLSKLTGMNLVIQEYLAVLFMTFTAIICWLLVRRTEGCPRWVIVPIGWILLSMAQYENLLVGWQFKVPMMNFFAAAAIYLLSSERWREFPAVGCAVAATFSFANGLLIWPSGCIAAAASERSTRWRTLAIWLSAAVVAAVAYRWGYEGFDRVPQGYLATVLHKPGDAGRLFLALYGSNFGEGRIPPSLVAGGALLALTAAGFFLLWRYGGLRRSHAPWFALWFFSAASVFAVVLGRSFAWEAMATPSRFLTVAIFIPVSLVVVLSQTGVVLWRRGRPARALATAVGLVLVLLALRQGLVTARVGWITGVAHRALKERSLPCLLQYRTASVECLRGLYVADGELVRRNTAILERWRLGPFSEVSPSDARRSSLDSLHGTLDFVGVRGPSGAPAAVRRGDRAIAEGWTLTQDLDAPNAVLLAIDGRWVAATAGLHERRDVSKFFQRSVPPCGWRLQFSTEDLAPGEHRVRALALPAGAPEPVPLSGEKILVVQPK